MTLQNIVSAIESRLQAIKITSSFNTELGLNVKRGNVRINPNELPMCCVYISERSNGDTSGNGKRVRAEASLIVEAHSSYADDPEDVAIKLLSDIQKAVELEDQDLSGLLHSPGLVWEGDAISYPDEQSNIVSVAVTYSVPHHRYYGDPTK